MQFVRTLLPRQLGEALTRRQRALLCGAGGVAVGAALHATAEEDTLKQLRVS